MSDSQPDAIGCSLALVLWSKDSTGEDDVAVFSGVLEKEGEKFVLRRDQDHPAPVLEDEWISRIAKVDPDLKDTLLNCDYQLSLSVGEIEDNEGVYERFGLVWPRDA